MNLLDLPDDALILLFNCLRIDQIYLSRTCWQLYNIYNILPQPYTSHEYEFELSIALLQAQIRILNITLENTNYAEPVINLPELNAAKELRDVLRQKIKHVNLFKN